MREIRKGDRVEFQGKPGKFDRPRGEVLTVWAQAKPDGSLGRMCRVLYLDGTMHNAMDDRLKRIHKFSDGQQVLTVDTGDAHLDWHPSKRSGREFGVQGKVLGLFDTKSGSEPYYTVAHNRTSAFYDEDELDWIEMEINPDIKGGSRIQVIESTMADKLQHMQGLRHRRDPSVTPHVGVTGTVKMCRFDTGICTVEYGYGEDYSAVLGSVCGSDVYHVSELVLLGSTDYLTEQLDQIDKALDGLKLNEKQ